MEGVATDLFVYIYALAAAVNFSFSVYMYTRNRHYLPFKLSAITTLLLGLWNASIAARGIIDPSLHLQLFRLEFSMLPLLMGIAAHYLQRIAKLSYPSMLNYALPVIFAAATLFTNLVIVSPPEKFYAVMGGFGPLIYLHIPFIIGFFAFSAYALSKIYLESGKSARGQANIIIISYTIPVIFVFVDFGGALLQVSLPILTVPATALSAPVLVYGVAKYGGRFKRKVEVRKY